MKQKLLDLLEKHVDKLILLVIAIVSLAVLWFFVISNPYGAEHKFQKYGPGKLDAKIKIDAESLQQRINGDATEPPRIYKGQKAQMYIARMSSTVDINERAVIHNVSTGAGNIEDKRFYRKPEIPAVEGVDAEVIRTAVFVPAEKVDMTLSYEEAKTEVSDIDFVTVQASIDVAELYKNFKSCFFTNAAADYRDEKLAVPVFALVGLERQVLGRDGQWSDWEVVNRPSIDRRRDMFKIPEKAGDIDLGGIDVLVMNFEKFDVQKDLLQPVAYDIAASNAEWMTPGYHKELVEFLEKEAKNAEMKSGGRIRPGSRGGRSVTPAVDTASRYGTRPGRKVRPTRTRPGTRVPANTGQKDRTIEDIRADFDFLKITEDLDLSLMKEPLVFWAFDEDIKPLCSYRYRMRVGVFNPTAGKGWFSGADAAFKDDVILWSDYSDVTDKIEIEPMIYFFPLEVARRSKAATIQVSKFHDGKWRSEDFEVQVGESIGQEVEVAEEDTEKPQKRSKMVEEIETIDFSSGAILVDIVESGRSVAGGRPFQEILYTENGGDIKHLGISKRNWSKALSSVFKEIEAQQDIIVEIYDSRGMSGRGMYPSGPGGDMEGYEDMLFMEEMDRF